MRVLHHYQLSASARFIRLVLAERGLVFLQKRRVAEWKRDGNDERLIINSHTLTDLGINVSANRIRDAIDELMKE